MRFTSPRRGFTRVQAIITILIVAFLIGMGWATLTRMREAADRVKCQNNLKQLAIGVWNFQASSQDQLPPLVDQGEGASTSNGVTSCFYSLIPYLEATVLIYRRNAPKTENYNAHSTVSFKFQWKDGTRDTQFGGDANQVMRYMIDPADRSAVNARDVPMTLPDGSTGFYATGSYAANGLLPWGQPWKSLDGNSNLIMFGERPQVCNTPEGEVVYNLWGLGFYSPHMPTFATLTPNEPPGLLSTGQIAPVLPMRDEASIEYRVGRMDAAKLSNEFDRPFNVCRGSGPCDPRLPATPHRAGMQVAMADGSVRVYSPTTSPWIFWSACVPQWTESPTLDR